MTFVKFQKPQANRKPAFGNFFDEIFNTAFNDLPNTTNYRPNVNIIDSKDTLTLELAVPGLKKEDFDINIEKDTLTISAKLEKAEKEDDTKYLRREFSFKSFSRSFTLPETVETEGIGAKYENGILSVSLPKKEEAKELPPRKVKIV